jgi:hypothetical protein
VVEDLVIVGIDDLHRGTDRNTRAVAISEIAVVEHHASVSIDPGSWIRRVLDDSEPDGANGEWRQVGVEPIHMPGVSDGVSERIDHPR